MDNRYTTFGLSRKNAGTWIAAVLMLAAACLRIVSFAIGGSEGLVYTAYFDSLLASSPSSTAVNGWWFFLSVVLPVFAELLFIVKLIVFGRDRLYKTGGAALLLTVFFIMRYIWLFSYAEAFASGWLLALHIAVCAAALLIWDLTANGAKIRSKLPAALVFAALTVLHAVMLVSALRRGAEPAVLIHAASVLLIPAAFAVCALSLERITSEGFRPRRGDRPDGRLVRSLDPINGVAVYIMPTRNGSATYFRDTIECSKVEEFIRRKREEGMPGFGMLHLIAAAYIRVLSKHPACNRYISGQKIFSRDGNIELAMAVKKEMKAEAPETIIKVYFDPGDTVDDVFRKYTEQIAEAKNTPLDSGFDSLAWLINAVPGVLKKLLVWLLKTFDYFGLLPAWLMRLSPFHGSVFVTDLGSLGIPPVFHHLYDFGNIPAFIAFGARRTVTEPGPDGAPVRKKYMDFTIVTDERICDGFYYASAFKSFRRFLNNPEKLEVPPEKVEKDVF